MISILASPKNFNGYIGEIQENAIRSWRRLHPGAEIFLYGNSSGAAEICEKHGLGRVGAIACSESGAPYFDAIIKHADAHASHDLQLFVNSDILLPPDFLETTQVVSKWARFLVVGQRIDLHKDVWFDAGTADWKGEIRRLAAQQQAALQPPGACDYFLFKRATWSGLRPLLIGRAGIDAALIAFCLRNRIPVVDASRAIHAVHQWHDYSHVPGLKREVRAGAQARRNNPEHDGTQKGRTFFAYQGAEASLNKREHDVAHSSPGCSDADYALQGGRLLPNRCRGDRIRFWETRLRYRLGWKSGSYALRALWRVLDAAHLRGAPILSLSQALGN